MFWSFNGIAYFECSIHWRRCAPGTLRFRGNRWDLLCGCAFLGKFDYGLFFLFLIYFSHYFIKITDGIFERIEMFIYSFFIWFLDETIIDIDISVFWSIITCRSSLFVLIESSIVCNKIIIIKNKITDNKRLYHRRLIYNK